MEKLKVTDAGFIAKWTLEAEHGIVYSGLPNDRKPLRFAAEWIRNWAKIIWLTLLDKGFRTIYWKPKKATWQCGGARNDDWKN